MNGLANLAEPDLGPLSHDGDIRHAQRRAELRLQHRLTNILHVVEQPDRPHIHLLQTGFHETPAGVDVVASQLLFHLSDAQSIGNELGRVNHHLIFPCSASEAGHIHDIRNGLELLFQRPVLKRLQLHQVILRICALQGVPINLPYGTPIGAHLRLQTLRKSHLREPL